MTRTLGTRDVAATPMTRKRGGGHPRLALLICGLLLMAQAMTALFAVKGKSATFDEPRGLLAAYLQRFEGDFRVNPEDPPLWKYFCSVTLSRQSLRVNREGKAWDLLTRRLPEQGEWCTETLYRTPGNNSDPALFHVRVMMMVLATTLGAIIAWWSWQLAGTGAAMMATAIYALDPNFIGHGPLLKGDVAITLATLGVAMCVWRLGRQVSIGGCIALALCCAAAICTKFSAVLLIPTVGILLVLRAVSAQAWAVFGRQLPSRAERLVLAGALLGLIAVFSYAGIWACYRFTYAATGTGDTSWPAVDELRHQALLTEIAERDRSPAPRADKVGGWEPSIAFRLYDFADRRRLLPQAFLAGLLFQHEATQVWSNFLLGQSYINGRWYYFALAILFKEPVAVLLAMILAAGVLACGIRRDFWWDIICLLLPAMVFMAATMTSNLNIGVRHMFPILALTYIGVGCAGILAIRRWPRTAQFFIVMLLLGQTAETAWGYPDYIAFFNLPSGGSRGGIELLADSNLDWGQDVKLLGGWQQQHPDQQLYVCLYGATDPAYYGVRYRSFPGGTADQAAIDTASLQQPLSPGVLAVSATILQGVYLPKELREIYRPLLEQKPLAVLGGTIYLYELSPATSPAP